MALHQWEHDLERWDNCIEPNDGLENSDNEQEFDYNTVDEETALREAGNMLVYLKVSNRLNAREACTLCFWLSKAGLGGLVRELAVHPKRPPSQYSKHFDIVIRRDDPGDTDLYEIQVPLTRRSDAARVVETVPMWTPFEAAEEEIASTLDIEHRLREWIRDQAPPRYHEHVVVREAAPETPVYPYALYVDGVKFSRTDGAIGFWLCNLVTHLRQLIMTQRKTELCSCGCRGWCTIYSIMCALAWSFNAMAAGMCPGSRHDHKPWRPLDHIRQAVAGCQMSWRAAIMYVKIDMMEFVTTFGFPSWMTAVAPCPFCHCTLDNWSAIAGISPLSLPWALRTFEDYQQACRRCERWVLVDTDHKFRRIRGSLQYDKTKDGGRGRVLGGDIPEYNLQKEDRLEPNAAMPDVAEYDTMTPGPNSWVLFWRRSMESSVRRRNPMFSEFTSITPESVFVEDWLHMNSLGIYKYWINPFLHTLFDANIFDIARGPVEAYIAVCVNRLRELLWAWYSSEAAAGRIHARMQDFPVSIVGLTRDSTLGTWGAETNGLLLFCGELLSRYGGRLAADVRVHMELGMSSILAIHKIITTYKTGRLPNDQIQCFADNWKIHLRAMRSLQIGFKPKHHAMAHCIFKLMTHGAPHVWSNWVDESENKLLSNMALAAHRLVWARRILVDHRMIFGVRRSQRPRR